MTRSRGSLRLAAARTQSRGVALIEVLVALVVTLFGLFALLGLSLKLFQTESESYQRSQALILVEDMAQRIRANRPNAASYVANAANALGSGAVETCSSTAPVAARDLCEWGNLLRGAAISTGGRNVGSMSDARGCIVVDAPATPTTPGPTTVNVIVVWRGALASATNASAPCVPDGFSTSDGYMRYTSSVVRFADLDGS